MVIKNISICQEKKKLQYLIRCLEKEKKYNSYFLSQSLKEQKIVWPDLMMTRIIYDWV